MIASSSTSFLETVANIVNELKHKPGALLPILHKVQKTVGYIPKESVKIIATALQQTPAEIHGVISFYHHFRTTVPGRNNLQICRGEACQARGGCNLEVYIKNHLKVDYHQTTADEEISLSPVYCLGNCARGPSLRLNDDIKGSVTNDKFDKIISNLNTFTVELI